MARKAKDDAGKAEALKQRTARLRGKAAATEDATKQRTLHKRIKRAQRKRRTLLGIRYVKKTS
jgi:hypothetical protein